MSEWMCEHYCSHGGRCTLPPDHLDKGVLLHDASGDCQWPSSESLTREQADVVLAQQPGGQDFLDYMQPMADWLEASSSDEEDDDD